MIDKLIQVELYPFKVTINWGLVKSFPAFQQLNDTPQSPVWHAEGNAWIHAKLFIGLIIMQERLD